MSLGMKESYKKGESDSILASSLAASIARCSEAPPLADVPRDLEKIVSRCLRRDPAWRFQHMDDLAIALRELKEESDSGKLSATAPPTGRRWRSWHLSSALAGISVLLIAALACRLLTGAHESSRMAPP